MLCSSSKIDEFTGKPNVVPTVTLTSETGNKAQIKLFNIFVGQVRAAPTGYKEQADVQLAFYWLVGVVHRPAGAMQAALGQVHTCCLFYFNPMSIGVLVTCTVRRCLLVPLRHWLHSGTCLT